MKLIISLVIASLSSTAVLAANQEIKSFSKAKAILEKQVYDNHRRTLYCGDI